MKVLILGVSGMLGNALFKYFSSFPNITTYATSRSSSCLPYFDQENKKNIITNIDVEKTDALLKLMGEIKPNIVINCIGVVKQLKQAYEPLECIPLNSIFPHRLAEICKVCDARMIHISTDCVFTGAQGNYKETDIPDALDLYGRSKLLGEVSYPHTVTLRTSIIGHELEGNRSLIDWFLSQQGQVKGFRKAIYSGFPTIEIARIIHEYILPNPKLSGLYHLASNPINKFDLISLVKEVYKKKIDIEASDDLVIDRSLNAEKFNKETGFIPLAWPELVMRMHTSQVKKFAHA